MIESTNWYWCLSHPFRQRKLAHCMPMKSATIAASNKPASERTSRNRTHPVSGHMCISIFCHVFRSEKMCKYALYDLMLGPQKSKNAFESHSIKPNSSSFITKTHISVQNSLQQYNPHRIAIPQMPPKSFRWLGS